MVGCLGLNLNLFFFWQLHNYFPYKHWNLQKGHECTRKHFKVMVEITFWAVVWFSFGNRTHSWSNVPSNFGSYFYKFQESLSGSWASSTFLSCILYQGRETASLGKSPPLWIESHPVKSDWRECCSWQSPAFVPLTTVVFPLGPFQQDGVGMRVPNDPEAGGEWCTEWKTTLYPDIHPNSAAPQAQDLKNGTGRKPAYVQITNSVNSFSQLNFLYLGSSFITGNTCGSFVLCLKVLISFSSRNQHI